MVFTDEGVKRPNGEKYSDAAEKIIKGTKEGSKLRQISLRKLANEMEEQKMNKGIKKIKKGIPAHEDGKSGKEELAAEIAARKRQALDPTKMAIIELPDGARVLQDLYGNQYNFEDFGIVDMGDRPTVYTGVAPSAGKWNGSMNYAKQILNSKNIAKLKNTATQVFKGGTKPATVSTVGKGVKAAQTEKALQAAARQETFNMWQRLGNRGGVPAKTVESNVAAYRDASKASTNLWQYTPAQQAAANAAVEQAAYNALTKSNMPYWLTLTGMLGGAGTFLTYEATKDNKTPIEINNALALPQSGTTTNNLVQTDNVTTTTPVSNAVVQEPVKEVPTNKTGKKRTTNVKTISKPVAVASKLDTDKFGTSAPSFDVSKLSTNDYKFSKADNYVPVTKMDINPDEYVEEEPLPGTTNRSNANWQDALYRTAVLTQPLWGKAKAEPVNYEIANAKYLPTYVNIDPTLRAIDESMGIARYNQTNINPNTGAGMAYGLQAAANRAKQYADTYAYKQNAQNELIGKNVGIYNQWAQNKATTMNNVYDKVAANRATARNINRQNVSAALTNYGQMLSDDKKMAIERMKFNILKPAIRSTYEDATTNDLMNMYNSLFG